MSLHVIQDHGPLSSRSGDDCSVEAQQTKQLLRDLGYEGDLKTRWGPAIFGPEEEPVEQPLTVNPRISKLVTCSIYLMNVLSTTDEFLNHPKG